MDGSGSCLRSATQTMRQTTRRSPTQLDNFGPYRPRAIRFLQHHDAGWVRLKVYGIGILDATPSDPTLRAALALADESPPDEPVMRAGIDWNALDTYGVGSLIIHTGGDAIFVLRDIWVDRNMLRHHVWVAPRSNPTAFESLDDSRVLMCVWEMAVLQHERRAWIDHVMMSPTAARFDRYLSDVLNADL
jgi:hypothetical protein